MRKMGPSKKPIFWSPSLLSATAGVMVFDSLVILILLPIFFNRYAHSAGPIVDTIFDAIFGEESNFLKTSFYAFLSCGSTGKLQGARFGVECMNRRRN